jgi:hypothetical protein
MELVVLQTVRLLAPGVMIYLLLVGICWATRWCELTVPNKLEDITKLFAVVVLGTIYNISDLTEWSNRKYFDRVNQNLTIRLTEPFKNDPEVPKNLTWSKVRLVFYKIVDSDESLKVKAKLAYRNGAFWASVADLRVISAIGCVVFLCLPIAPYLIQNAKF